MPHDKKHIQIFVSCPSDVSREKQVVKEVADDINKVLTQQGCPVHFEVREWSEVTGQIGIQAQDLITDTIKDYDIYLGILWMRFGTPTQNTNPATGEIYQSGTEEEFELAYSERKRNGKRPVIYFYCRDAVATPTLAETEQWIKVLKFRERLMAEGMPNSFKNPEHFRKLISLLIFGLAMKECRESWGQEKTEFLNEDNGAGQPKMDRVMLRETITRSLSGLPVIKDYIPRRLRAVYPPDESAFFGESSLADRSLEELLLKHKRIVILGNAGSGKSVELQRLAQRYQDPSFPFLPVYQRLNNYVDEHLRDFLPENWQLVDPAILLLLLDGLDEVQPQHFNTAIRRINQFTQQHPDVRMVVSCRTNFYAAGDQGSAPALPDFHTFELEDIRYDNIEPYVDAHYGLEGEKFMDQVYRHDFRDLVVKPFFLNILAEYFKKAATLSDRRAAMIEHYIASRLTYDQEHFKTTARAIISREQLMALLKRIGLAMEMMGKNQLSGNELFRLVTDPAERAALQYFSAFNEINGRWSFAHNNIQEYFAALALADKPMKMVQEMMTVSTELQKIKPAWVNTLAFLISIVDDATAGQLLNWLLEIDAELVVKMEKDRLPSAVRTILFKDIFNRYREKNIWLRSAKFNLPELARFGESTETTEWLLDILGDPANSMYVKLNAIEIIEHFESVQGTGVLKKQLKKIVMDLLSTAGINEHFVYSLLRSVTELHLADEEMVTFAVATFGHRKNQYIRSGLYLLVIESGLVNEYVDLFLGGIVLPDDEESKEDRDPVSLGDESLYLKRGLEAVTTPEALHKVFRFFENPLDRRHIRFYDKEEVFATLVNHAIAAYPHDPTLKDTLRNLFLSTGKLGENRYAIILKSFFEKTHTKVKLFETVWTDKTLPDIEKIMLLLVLLDEELVDWIVDQYVDRNFNNSEIAAFHQTLTWYLHRFQPDSRLIDRFEQKFNEHTSLKLSRPPKPDFNAIQRENRKRSLDVLFDKNRMSEEIDKIFAAFDKTELSFDDLWFKQDKPMVAEPAMDLVNDLLREFKEVSRQEFADWMDQEPRYTKYQMSRIRDFLEHPAEPVELSSEQLAAITEWTTKKAAAFDWTKMVVLRDREKESFAISSTAELLWFFIQRFNIRLPDDQLLQFTAFGDFRRRNNTEEEDLIATVAIWLGELAVNKKVIANLENGLPVSMIWKNNAVYAIRHSLRDAYPAIIRDIKGGPQSVYTRAEVLAEFFRSTKDVRMLKEIIEAGGINAVAWQGLSLLQEMPSEHAFVIERLKHILSNTSLEEPVRLKAARMLITLNDLNGLNFYADYIIARPDAAIDFHHLQPLASFSNIEGLNRLIELLRYARTTQNSLDRFHELDSFVIGALQNLALQSAENLQNVKQALLDFIRDNEAEISDLNFLHLTIARIEEQFYANHSAVYSLDDALQELKKIGV